MPNSFFEIMFLSSRMTRTIAFFVCFSLYNGVLFFLSRMLKPILFFFCLMLLLATAYPINFCMKQDTVHI